jgi:hypothetical protein
MSREKILPPAGFLWLLRARARLDVVGIVVVAGDDPADDGDGRVYVSRTVSSPGEFDHRASSLLLAPLLRPKINANPSSTT